MTDFSSSFHGHCEFPLAAYDYSQPATGYGEVMKRQPSGTALGIGASQTLPQKEDTVAPGMTERDRRAADFRRLVWLADATRSPARFAGRVRPVLWSQSMFAVNLEQAQPVSANECIGRIS